MEEEMKYHVNRKVWQVIWDNIMGDSGFGWGGSDFSNDVFEFRMYHWDDTERLRQEADAKKAEVMARQGYSGEEIDNAIAAGTMPEKPPELQAEREEVAPIDLNEPEYFEDDLTEEDKKYLTIKWGKAYRPYEWV